MKTKQWYNDKISVARAQIEKWELELKQLDAPPPLKAVKEKTRSISFRVKVKDADALKKEIRELIHNKQ